jgi:type I restriction enzyme S subunit
MSSNEWREVKLGEIVDIEMGQSPKSEFYNTEGLGVPFLQGNKTFGMIYPKFDVFCTNVKKIAIQNDILMSVRAPVGDLNIAQEKICIGRGICAMRMKNRNNLYLFYLLKHNVKNLKKTESGTVFGGVNKKDIMGLSVMWTPNLQEQKTIAATLSCLDDKIELNNRINKTLEEMAQAIFKSWFVDFEPFQNGEFIDSELGKIPKGWRVISIEDISQNIICGKTPPTKKKENYGDQMPFITIPDMNSHVYVTETKRSLSEKGIKTQLHKTLPANSVLVSCIATPGLVALTSEESQTNQQINSIICKETISCLYLFLCMKNYSNEIKNLGSSGSTILNLNKTQFSKIRLILPTKNILDRFHQKVEQLFNYILQCQRQAQMLKGIRDALLPKLMSGEVRVPIEEVL